MPLLLPPLGRPLLQAPVTKLLTSREDLSGRLRLELPTYTVLGQLEMYLGRRQHATRGGRAGRDIAYQF